MNQNNNCNTGNGSAFDAGPSGRSRGVAGLLAIFLGSLGIQYFYLGKTQAGIIAIVLSLVTCGALSVLWLIQGILMIAMNEQDFERKFVYTNSTFPLF
ncbi:MAG: TM2 domain-containing protein [Paramuribaculum sp.]|nr:TM2 domain-containing protein [Candidatus Amulumruptor sp.]MDE6545134.1 TM2 domain-containing protein [Paramuribaculum sp.]MDE6587151.1 TM2 domain-containing protein [Paramuribaculum sp.]MDE7151493.1 TM2 domain-containing protein [Candidatus Amulumruptor sp.]